MIISVVIPCYNVAKHIAEVVNHVPGDIHHIILVNDCSKDDTECEILKLMQANDKIVYLKHEKNKGVGGAMITGFMKSLELNSDITIKLDGDNQMDTSYIPHLIKPIKEGRADVAKGNRFRDFRALKSMPAIRRFGNFGLSFLIKAASGYWNLFDPANGYLAYNKYTLENINYHRIHNRYFFESSMLIEMYYANSVIVDVPMKAKYGTEVSNLSVTRTLFEFPPKLFYALIRRVLLKYFLYDFNIASLYTIFGSILFISGSVYGLVGFLKYAGGPVGAPTGTVVIPTLLITLGVQFLLSAISYDINNFPKKEQRL